MLTTKEIIKLARLKLLELTSDVLGDDAIFLYLNLAYQDLQMKTFTKSGIITDVITITGGESSLPSNFRALAGKPTDANGNTLGVVGYEDFTRANESSRTVSIRGNKLYSKLGANLGAVSIGYYATYPKLTITQDPETDRYFDETLIYGTIARAFEDLQDEEMAQLKKQEFDNMVTTRMGIISQNEENITESSMFNGISII